MNNNLILEYLLNTGDYQILLVEKLTHSSQTLAELHNNGVKICHILLSDSDIEYIDNNVEVQAMINCIDLF